MEMAGWGLSSRKEEANSNPEIWQGLVCVSCKEAYGAFHKSMNARVIFNVAEDSKTTPCRKHRASRRKSLSARALARRAMFAKNIFGANFAKNGETPEKIHGAKMDSLFPLKQDPTATATEAQVRTQKFSANNCHKK